MPNDLENEVGNENNIPSNDSSALSVAVVLVTEHLNVAASLNFGNISSNENNQNDIPNVESSTEKKTKHDVSSMTTEADLFEKIQSLHCPFTWKPEEHLRSYRHDEIENFIDIDEMFEESGFKLRRYVIHMILCYNNFAKRLIDDSIKHLDEMEKMLLTSMKHKSRDVYFTSINEALFHVTQSCRVYMLNETNQKEKALQILRKITPYDELNDRNKAGIWAVRANLYVEFGYLGIKAAIEYIKKSTTIDSENPYWYFTKGMYLGRLRRLENGLAVPSVDEISALEFAMKLKEDASFMAFAAEVYTETANRSMKQFQELFFNCKESEKNELFEQNEKLNKHAAMLFKKSVSLNSNCSHLLFRCGKGLLKLPPPHQDLKLAHEYIKKGLEISYDSSYGNHAMAMYYEKHKKNYDLAKKYLTKASEQRNFGADIDLIRIDFLQNRDPESLLNSLLKLFDLYNDKLKHRKIIAEIISYYLFVNYNLVEAINYMKKLLYLTSDQNDIVNIHKSGILRQRLPVSLLEVLLSDITDRSNQGKLTPDVQELCKTFFNQLCFQSVTLPVPNSQNLRKKVVSEIKANFKNMQLENIKRSETKTQTEEPCRKDYNPIESRFNREYAKKYYYEAKEEKSEKTVVDEFFEKYEESKAKRNMAKSKPINDKKTDNHNKSDFENKSKGLAVIDSQSLEKYDEITRRENRVRDKPINDEKTDDIKKKSKDSNSHLEEIFSKFKSSKRLNLNPSNGSESESDNEKEAVYRLAKQFERRFDISPDSKSKDNSREKNSRDRSPHYRENHRRKSRDGSRSKRHSVSPDKKRSGSHESKRSTKTSHKKRSTSRDSRISHSSRIKRSTSRDTVTSRSSHKKRSVSRESAVSTRKRRSVSRDSHVSHRKKRSVSRESHASSRKKRSVSRESRVSRNKRSVSKESSRRNRSISRERSTSTSSESHKSTRADRHKNHNHEKSKDTNFGTSKQPSSSRQNHRSSTRSPSNRRRDDRRKNRDYDRKYKSQESHESSTSETSRSSSRSPAERDKKQGRHRDGRYDSNDTLKSFSRYDSDNRRRRSDSSGSTQSKRSSRKNRHHRHRSSKSPAKRSHSRESYRSTKESRGTRHKDDRYRKRDYEEKRSSKEKYEKSNDSDRDFSDRTERSGSYRSKDSNHRDLRRSDEKENHHRQKNEKLSNDSDNVESSASHSSHSEKEQPADEENPATESK